MAGETYIGSPCPQGHTLRYVLRKRCVICTRDQWKRADLKRVRPPEYKSKRRAYIKEYKRLWRQRPDHALQNHLRVILSHYTKTFCKGPSSLAFGIDWEAIRNRLGPCPGDRDAWVIDHIEPCCAFDHRDPEQVRRCWSPDNLRWLKKADNLIKAKEDKKKSLVLLKGMSK